MEFALLNWDWSLKYIAIDVALFRPITKFKLKDGYFYV